MLSTWAELGRGAGWVSIGREEVREQRRLGHISFLGASIAFNFGAVKQHCRNSDLASYSQRLGLRRRQIEIDTITKPLHLPTALLLRRFGAPCLPQSLFSLLEQRLALW